MAAPKRPVDGVPFPGHRGTLIPARDPASRRAQRTSGPPTPTSGGGRELTGCGRLLWLLIAAIVGSLIVLGYAQLTGQSGDPQPATPPATTPKETP